jgi:hypothetical protein
VIKFVSDLQQVSGFLLVLQFPFTNKTDRHDITEILLKVALNTISLTLLLMILESFFGLNLIFLLYNIQTTYHILFSEILKIYCRIRKSNYFPPFLGHLRPSRELLEYYRKKIAEYDEEHDHMVNKLEEYKITYEEQVSILLDNSARQFNELDPSRLL